MKLAEIKSRMIDAFFTSKGEGVGEDQLDGIISSLGSNVLKEDASPLVGAVMAEHEDPLAAYRELSKGKMSCGCVCEDGNMLYVMVRNGKQLACINLTAPTRVERGCTFREVKEVFTQAADLDSSVTYRTFYV